MRLFFPALLLICLATACGKSWSGKALPPVQDGRLDLRNWDFAKDGPVRLDGPWEFYWKRFLDSEQLKGAGAPRPDALLRIPGTWKNFQKDGRELGPYGFATFRLRILHNGRVPRLALNVSDMFTSYEVAVNGRVVGGRGRIGRTAADEVPRVMPAWSDFHESSGEMEVILRIANFHHFRGRIKHMTLGPAEVLREQRERRIAFEIFVVGTLLIMGVYHLFLWMLRTGDRSPLYFGIFCLLVTTYTALTGMRYFMHLFPDVSFHVYWTVNFAAFTACPAVFLLFLASIFPRESHPALERVALGTAIVLIVLIVFLPTRWVIGLLPAFAGYIALMGIYYIYVLSRAIIRKREGSLLFLIGWLVFFIGIANDLLFVQQIIATGYYAGFGLVFFIFFQAAMLSMRFARAFRTVENLTEELEANNQELQRVDRLKDEFLANTSHELRTPLNGIIGIADSLLEGAAGPMNEKAMRSLGLIVTSGSRLAGLINDILDFEKLRNHDVQLNRRPADLGQIVDVVLAVSHPLVAGKDLELRNELPADLPAVLGDENRLQQIFHNLIGNAVKFTPAGEVKVMGEVVGDKIRVTVADDGIGIPPEKQEEIFKSFQQADASTEREYGGTGLGLSITRQLIELHGGSIRVESEPDRGARFIFDLPVSDETAADFGALSNRARRWKFHSPPEDLPVTEANQATDGRTVLVVDDESVNRSVLVNLLSLRKYQVVEAGDGEEALRILDEKQPDAVLLDIMMPRMNGYEVCRRIREKLSAMELPVIFLSAKNQVEDLLAGLESGGNDYLPKPFSAPELLARVRTQTNLKESHAEALRLREQLVHHEKLAAVGSMAAGIVHDFKNPVSVIKGYAMMADDASVQRDLRSEYLGIVSEEADRLADMAQDILDYSRGSFELEKTEMDSEEFALMAERFLKPYLDGKDIKFKVDVARLDVLRMDERRMLRVLRNITGNAADAISNSGRQGKGEFHLRLRSEKDRVLLELRDNGPGIAEEIRETLFEPFVTLGKPHGTGLGLAITRGIVEAHGGSIRFETGAKGTVFFIELPA